MLCKLSYGRFSAFFDVGSEKGVLRVSIAAILTISCLGIGFGFLSGSASIMFDGFYGLVDASMGLLSLFVVNLITSHSSSDALPKELRDRFTMGFWHFEPMVLAVNGTLLITIAVYAFFNAVSSVFEGGRDMEFGWAIVYSALTALVCWAIAFVEARANRRIKSDFVALDVKGWTMSASITTALLIAFSIGFSLEGTKFEWATPYIDPVVLAIVCLLIIPVPISTIRRALSDIFLITPADLKQHVDEVAHDFVVKYGFSAFRAYVARVGRSRAIEIYFIVPHHAPARPIAEWDRVRDEISEAIGGDDEDRWLSVVFTGDLNWAE